MTTGEYAKEIRNERGFTTNQICMGLCSESLYRNYEIGKRTLDVFVQNRIMERLGYSTNKMYYVLKAPTMSCFQKRMEILYNLIKGDYEGALKIIELFSKDDSVKEPLHKQYLCRMQAFYEMCVGGKDTVITDYLEQALSCTVPGFKTEDYKKQCLATCEVDMLLDWYYYKEEQEPEDHLNIATYCEEKGYDEVQMSQIYPKAIWYAYEIAKKKQPLKNWESVKIWKYCSLLEKALQHLRKQKKGYYLWEVLSANVEILNSAMQIKQMIEETIDWDYLFRDGEKYFTEYEFRYLCGYLQVAERNAEYDFLFHMIEDYCNKKMGDYEELVYAPLLGMMGDEIQSEYGDNGEFEISNRYCWKIIEFSYYIKDLARIEYVLYGIWWNKKEETKTADKEMLSWLIDLAELIEDSFGKEFMEEKLSKI